MFTTMRGLYHDALSAFFDKELSMCIYFLTYSLWIQIVVYISRNVICWNQNNLTHSDVHDSLSLMWYGDHFSCCRCTDVQMGSAVLDAFLLKKRNIYIYFPSDVQACVGMNMIPISGKWDSNLWPNNVSSLFSFALAAERKFLLH